MPTFEVPRHWHYNINIKADNIQTIWELMSFCQIKALVVDIFILYLRVDIIYGVKNENDLSLVQSYQQSWRNATQPLAFLKLATLISNVYHWLGAGFRFPTLFSTVARSWALHSTKKKVNSFVITQLQSTSLKEVNSA